MSSLRQKLIDAVVVRMRSINGNGSYETTLGTTIDKNGNSISSVMDSRLAWDESELPAISVFDGDSNAVGKTGVDPNAITHRMPVLVRGFVVQDEDTAINARKLIKDIMTAIRQDDRWTVTGTKLVIESNEVHDGIARNERSFEIEACEVEFEVFYITQKFNAEAL